MSLLFDSLALVCRLYALWASLKALQRGSVRDVLEWLQFWISLSAFLTIVRITDVFVWWVPFYDTIKWVVMMYLQLSQTWGGQIIYSWAVAPTLGKYHDEIEIILGLSIHLPSHLLIQSAILLRNIQLPELRLPALRLPDLRTLAATVLRRFFRRTTAEHVDESYIEPVSEESHDTTTIKQEDEHEHEHEREDEHEQPHVEQQDAPVFGQVVGGFSRTHMRRSIWQVPSLPPLSQPLAFLPALPDPQSVIVQTTEVDATLRRIESQQQQQQQQQQAPTRQRRGPRQIPYSAQATFIPIASAQPVESINTESTVRAAAAATATATVIDTRGPNAQHRKIPSRLAASRKQKCNLIAVIPLSARSPKSAKSTRRENTVSVNSSDGKKRRISIRIESNKRNIPKEKPDTSTDISTDSVPSITPMKRKRQPESDATEEADQPPRRKSRRLTIPGVATRAPATKSTKPPNEPVAKPNPAATRSRQHIHRVHFVPFTKL
ncbi:hypothetical protein GQ42DRAFT_152049 [Ramicandelaber brevisporus]|nr:hypothetical protein GQ42DRAFT_152049 [Ramicandelaber brevisporus]